MTKLPKEMVFFIFLLEQYAWNKKTTADKVLKRWDNLKLSELIYNMYERYHGEAIENAIKDIDKLMAEQKQR